MQSINTRVRTIWLYIGACILALLLPAAAYAAEDTVKSIEFDNPESVFLYVEQSTHQLKVLATVDGATAKKDVTNDAYWSSSIPQAVKVEKGLLTPVGKGTSTITAKYKGYSISLSVTSDFLFKELKLNSDSTIQAELGDPAIELSAFAVENDGNSYEVTGDAAWTSSNTGIATVSKGKVTLVGKGTATITVRHKGLSDSVNVEVKSPYSSIAIEPGTNLEFLVGQDETALKAKATLLNGQIEDVTDKATWSTSNSSIFTVDKGKLKPVGSGTGKVTVGYLGVSKEVTVIVRLPYQALVINPNKEQDLFTNDPPVQITAKVANDSSSYTDVTSTADWVSSNPMVATVDRGLVTPKSAGKSTVKVTYRGLSKEIDIYVYPVIADLTIDKKDITLFKGEVKDLPAVVAKNLEEREVDFSPLAEWTSSNEDIVKIENGKLVAGQPGTARLTAKLKGFSDSVQVTVQEKVLIIKSSYRMLSMVVGDEAALPAVRALMEDGTEQEISGSIKWKTSLPNLLVKDGKLKGLLGAKVNLEGTYLNKSVVIPVTIEEKIKEIVVEPESIELYMDRSQSIKVKGIYEDDKEINLSSKLGWTSSDTSVATVKGSFVKAAGEGTATLKAEYQNMPIEITVKIIPKLQKIQASENSFKLAVGESASAEISALYDTGRVTDVTEDATWISSNATIASVDNGKIVAHKKGTAYIKAIYNKKTVSIRVSVR